MLRMQVTLQPVPPFPSHVGVALAVNAAECQGYSDERSATTPGNVRLEGEARKKRGVRRSQHFTARPLSVLVAPFAAVLGLVELRRLVHPGHPTANHRQDEVLRIVASGWRHLAFRLSQPPNRRGRGVGSDRVLLSYCGCFKVLLRSCCSKKPQRQGCRLDRRPLIPDLLAEQFLSEKGDVFRASGGAHRDTKKEADVGRGPPEVFRPQEPDRAWTPK